jgi:hypothetical protein
MNRVLFPIVLLTILIAAGCQHASHHGQESGKTGALPAGNFGESISTEDAVPAGQLAGLFAGSDTVEVTLSGDIAASCKHSGCWMEMDIGNKEHLHVTFQDEKFTIPLDAAGKHAIAQGVAIRQLIPVETLRNYAREDGKSEEEVAMITEPVWSYEMVATGVLIEE